MTGSLRLAYALFCLAIAFAIWLIGYGLALKLLYSDGRILQATITTNPWAPLQQFVLYPDNPVLRRVGLGAAVPALFVAGIVAYVGLRPVSNPLGDAHFQNAMSLRRGKWFRRKGHILGRFGRQILRADDERHHLVIGPTRSGKGACYVIPNALTHEGSMIVTDLKGEIFRSTAGYRKSRGNQVFLFAPGSDRTHRYNPLDFIRTDRGDRTTDIQNIASILVPESIDSENSIWQATAQQVMAGAISYINESVFYRGRRNLGEVTAFFNSGVNLQALMGLIKEKEPNLSRFTEESFNAYIALSERAAASALLDIQKALRPFRNERVVAATSVTDMDLRALKYRPISIYLAPNITDITLLRPLLALFVQQTLDTLLLEHDRRSLPVYFLLDEFRQLKKLTEITSKLPYVAGYNIKMAFIVQDLKNLDEIYGETARQSLMGNCGYQLVLGANDQATAEAVSKSLGRRTVRYRTESRTIELMGLHRRTKVEQLRERDLMMPQEIRQLPSEKMLVLAEGQNPVLADKLRFFATKPFREQEAFSRNHVPAVPATEFLPPRPVPATTETFGNLGEGKQIPSHPPRTIAATGSSSESTDKKATAPVASGKSGHRGPSEPALEARFDSAAARLKTLVVAKSKESARDWSAIFDETVPDASPEFGLEVA
ncbi:type IV secretory system conjugative DNA transfer family protein [Mesorhizobium sp. M1A.F.Ca.ET.072.01.1.1]|uniref:type IV secretory system conjugative DNA transfer family protein n=1 Tax=Mesorhizobium sp. M1A.F.Ca.ET.072.01.1.1 TaxID=2496753 RepID=UPI000FD42D4E|nr:type IV secretory system conjugative DNA transfer family protein [Mesorhizobium sp. M1A.F.Ca.ET.072.01.1.1]RUW47808.1 type IV secretory system conjugative DNA transfer family protein [Mesorhizobium sp. M1A.F.Ca.ET.072.01.1.1]TIV04256.1 MAG: type IV secretory system conjugative DNA transfer family protein [Mesorhizobium sp.]